MVTATRLPVNSNASAVQMAQTIFGDGVTVVGASFTGDNRSSGIYSDGDSIASGVVPGDSGVILSTGRAIDFTNRTSAFNSANQSPSRSTNTNGVDNDPQFNALAGTSTFDAAILDVDFIPDSDVLSMQFVFASDEYPEFVDSLFNDIVGVWVNGTHVPLAVGDGTTSVNNINQGDNINLFVDNTGSDFDTEMDGFTVTMTLKMNVIPGSVNSVRIGIADVGDANYDASLLIAANSMQTALIANDDTGNVVPGGTKTIDVLANDTGPGGSVLVIAHVNGQPVTAGMTITLVTGQEVTLNADGTLTVQADADEETVIFTYKVAIGGGSGLSDTAFVKLNSIPCFVAGTRILTPGGQVRVEALAPGDLVLTRDEGPQPLQWIGRRRVAAEGAFAPVEIRANTFGMHRRLLVLPQHRVLVRTGVAEPLFGAAEVLVAVKDLVNGRTVRIREGGTVEYVHFLFHRHQLVWSEGLETESCLPGPLTGAAFEREIVEEIYTLFPEIDPATGQGYSSAVRRIPSSYEAQVLLAGAAA